MIFFLGCTNKQKSWFIHTNKYQNEKEYLQKVIESDKNLGKYFNYSKENFWSSYSDLTDLSLDVASYYDNKGYLDQALKFYKKAMEHTYKDASIIPVINIKIASIYQNMNFYNKAIKYLKPNLKLEDNIFTITPKRKTYEMLSQLYFKKKDFSKAIFYTKKMLNKNNKDYSLKNCQAHNLLGTIYLSNHDFSKAIKHFSYTLNIAKNQRFNPSSEYNIAKKKYYNETGKILTRSIHERNFLSTLHMHPYLDVSLSHFYLGKTYFFLKKSDKALFHLNSSYNYLKKQEYSETKQSSTLETLALLYLAKNDYKSFISTFKNAIFIKEKILGNNHPKVGELYETFASNIIDKYKKYYYYQKSFDIFMRYRARNFLILSNFEKQKYTLSTKTKMMNLLNIAYVSNMSHNVFNSWLNYKGSIFEDKNILSLLQSKNTNTIKLLKNYKEKIIYLSTLESEESSTKNFQFIQDSLNQIEIELNQESKKYKEFLGLKNITYQDISTHLKNNELYIDFIKTGENYYFFTLNKNIQINFIQINTKDSKTLELHIKNLKSNNQKMVQAIKNKTIKKEQAQLKKESHVILSKLYNILISKYLRTQLQTTKELIISPDGLLNFLPFEALYHNGKYLIEDYKISYTSSGRELVRQTKREPYKVGSRKMICFANPDFDASLPVSKTKLFGGNNQKSEEEWKEEKNFGLIGDEEIVTIKNLYKDALIYEHKEANVENLMKVGASQILHFSTHGKFLNNQTIENPMLKAGIALSGANVKGDLSGIVTALKVSALDLSNTELVVLSACESGLGEVQNGEGVMGLPKAFLQAGAREVIMSLWSVSNQKTAILMEKFYTNVQKNQDYNTALQNAKIDMINEEMPPYYWSAFIMHGIQN